MEFTLDTSVTAPSVAYLSSEYYYENGLSYKFMSAEGTELPASAVTAEYKDNRLTFTVNDPAYNGKTIKLSVEKK